jgi:hypothetical protein
MRRHLAVFDRGPEADQEMLKRALGRLKKTESLRNKEYLQLSNLIDIATSDKPILERLTKVRQAFGDLRALRDPNPFGLVIASIAEDSLDQDSSSTDIVTARRSGIISADVLGAFEGYDMANRLGVTSVNERREFMVSFAAAFSARAKNNANSAQDGSGTP